MALLLGGSSFRWLFFEAMDLAPQAVEDFWLKQPLNCSRDLTRDSCFIPQSEVM